MCVISKEYYDKSIKLSKRKMIRTSLFLLAIILCLTSYSWLAVKKLREVSEVYLADKVAYDIAVTRQELLLLIRSRPVTIGQALDVTDVIMRQRDVPIHMLMGIISQESEFDPRAVSHKGAVGIMQLMPATYEDYAVNPFLSNPRQIHDPVLNMEAGIACIKDLYIAYGDWKRVLRAYVGGKRNADNKKLDWYANGVLKKSEKFIKFNRKEK